MEQKVIGFGQNTILVKNFKISHYSRCNVSETFFNTKLYFFAKMEEKLIGCGQNTFFVKIHILLCFSYIYINNLII